MTRRPARDGLVTLACIAAVLAVIGLCIYLGGYR